MAYVTQALTSQKMFSDMSNSNFKEVKFPFLKEAEWKQEICLEYCKSKEQISDIVTKELP